MLKESENFFAQRLKVITILLWSFFSAYYIMVAPRELNDVQRVSKYQKVTIFINKTSYRKNPLSTGKILKAVEIYDPQFNRFVTIHDLAPGDFGGLLILKYFDKDAAHLENYQSNRSVPAYRSADGKIYFLFRGSYIPYAVIFAFSLLFWLMFLIRILNAGRAQKKETINE